jgi:hypothetical protein
MASHRADPSKQQPQACGCRSPGKKRRPTAFGPILAERTSEGLGGAGERARTADLVLTKDVLCQLSYSSDILERETRFELATTSLEG